MNETLVSERIAAFESGLRGLAQVGGKGANLLKMAAAGFPVPPGFVVQTTVYREYAQANGLDAAIVTALSGMERAGSGPAALETASARIRAAFERAPIPPDIAAEIRQAYAGLGSGPVAVRSSATAEDLPEMSFAGQQDTYLNVLGEQAVLQAVVRCWASLWTARAIGYRNRNGVAHTGAALAVVVQRMVASQAAGVLFTANPLSGLRSETVIDAALGLGEALVSGQVEPDHYVVRFAAEGGPQVNVKKLGAKALSIRGLAGGGTETLAEDGAAVQALPDEQIVALAELGQRVAQQYGGEPQDIEWAWDGAVLWLLQTRAITSLYPTPSGMPAEPLRALASFGALQGMLDPMTPYGQDVIIQIVVTVARMMLGRQITARTQNAIYSAGERLWANLTPILRNTVGRKVMRGAIGLVEPTIGQALEEIEADPRLQPQRAGIRPQTALKMARLLVPVGLNAVLNIARPEARARMIRERGEQTLRELESLARQISGSPQEKLSQRLWLLPELSLRELPVRFCQFVSGVASGVASLNMLDRAAWGQAVPAGQAAWHDLTLKITRGVPDNPTTQMDLALWKMARQIRADSESAAAFASVDVPELGRRGLAGTLPLKAQIELNGFLDYYGGRGLAEIDTGRPRWSEDPTHVIESLAGYLKIEDEERAPDVVFARSAAEAKAAVAELVRLVRQGRGGWLRARAVRFWARRARVLLSLRESPKFFAVRMMAVLRGSLLDSGREFCGLGALNQPDDIFYLSPAELEGLAAGKPGDYRTNAAARRERYQRELLRRQVPRLLLSDGRAFYEGIRQPAGSADELLGSPVSPGQVVGQVRVVLDPRQARLEPGEILVCPGTDPSWTPLFLTAGGLIMEVGGMMTHGAVVAREYGIPAVVSVDQATTRLVTGQRIQLDGSSGRIRLLANEESQ